MSSRFMALSPGDPSGVGPEITAEFLRHYPKGGIRPVVVSDRHIMDRAAQLLNATLPWRSVEWNSLGQLAHDEIGLVDLPWEGPLPGFGHVDPACGSFAYRCLESVAEALREGRIRSVVTGPISKEAIQERRPDFVGHTEFFAGVAEASRYGMLLCVDPLKAIHVTTHIPLARVASSLTAERVLKTIELAAESLQLFGETGSIAVCGLNPHAGEGGHFGDEELRIIRPAIERARGTGIDAVGPLPPDTVFYRALAGEFKIIVCMYHDQGHIPLKMLGFDRGVNVTVGLPFVRTSVDHGTAFELAGTGRASASSLEAAWRLAARLMVLHEEARLTARAAGAKG